MSRIPFYADADNGGTIYLEKIDPATAQPAPLTDDDGTVRAVISQVDGSDEPALAGLDVELDHQAASPGTWSYVFDAESSPREELDALGTEDEPLEDLFLVIIKPGGEKESQPLSYHPIKRPTLADEE